MQLAQRAQGVGDLPQVRGPTAPRVGQWAQFDTFNKYSFHANLKQSTEI